MKLWMSGEVDADVADAYQSARRKIVASVNDRLQRVDFAAGCKELAVIAIICHDCDPEYKEIVKYHRGRGVAEFRLKIDYQSFLDSNEDDRTKLVLDMLLRALDLMPLNAISQQDLMKIREVFAVF